MSHPATLGSLIASDADARRDAIHVAIAPFVAAPDARLLPGAPFGLDANGRAVPAYWERAVGVVDPFLKSGVRPGERFWGCVTPGAVTGLRHEWDHHVIAPAGRAAKVEIVERLVEKPEDPEVKAVREFAESHGMTLKEVIYQASIGLDDSCRGCN